MEDPMGKVKQQDNPFIEPSQQHAVVDMKGRRVSTERYTTFFAVNLTIFLFSNSNFLLIFASNNVLVPFLTLLLL